MNRGTPTAEAAGLFPRKPRAAPLSPPAYTHLGSTLCLSAAQLQTASRDWTPSQLGMMCWLCGPE